MPAGGVRPGRSAYRQELEDLIHEWDLDEIVRIVDHCDDMPAAYMLTDVVVSASTDPEAFGRVVAEAQALAGRWSPPTTAAPAKR